MANNAKKTNNKQSRPAHSAFENPVYGVIDNTPPKYLANGNINPAWKKQQGAKTTKK